MKSPLNKFILFTLFFLGITSYLQAEDTTKQTLPSVKVKTLNGSPVDIQEYGKTGKITVLFFWETYCSPSIKGLDNLWDVYEDWQSKYQCNIVAVNMDDSRNSSKVKPFVTGKGWPYIFLTDENRDLSRALNIPNCPYVILLDSQGHIVYRHSGFSEGSEIELEGEIKKLKK